MALTCADCGKRMQSVANSLPQGDARCQPCRRMNPSDGRAHHAERARPRTGTLTCAICANTMPSAKGSLPQGQATCQPCRRVLYVERGAIPHSSYRTPCASCGTPSYGKRCLPCAHKAQLIRHEDDSEIRRLRREQAAPGLTGSQRTKLLHKWQRQGRACSYCPRKADTIDHVLPLVRGGTNYEGNLTPCCRSCNGSKGGKMVAEWRHAIRLPPRTTPLPWRAPPSGLRKKRPRRWAEPRPLFSMCARCDALHPGRGMCTDCAAIENRIRSRNRYRAKVGLPLSDAEWVHVAIGVA